MNPQFVEMLQSLPPRIGGRLAHTLEHSSAEVSMRVNPAKGGLELLSRGDGVEWCPRGVRLAERPDFTRDPAMHQGRYYVQEASSMFIWHVARHLASRLPEGAAVLDACASPGGKTTALIDALEPLRPVVVANEYVSRRAAVLRENIIKWGYDRTIVTRGDAAALGRLRSAFHLVAVDAPCSGEGMMRKEAVAVDQWSPRLVEECAATQRAIVDALWDAVAPGGYLVYSTCTFNTRENEEIVDHLLATFPDAEPVEIPVEEAWHIERGVRPDIPSYRFIPGITRGEGLFIAVLHKSESAASSRPERRSKPQRPSKAPRLPESLLQSLQNASELTLLPAADNAVAAFPTCHLDLLRRVESTAADVIYRGVEVGQLAGRDYAPTQSLAMAQTLRTGAFPTCEVDRATALAYLRREAITIDPAAPRGHLLLTHHAYPLGFVKNLGTRANNLYPAPWRILSTH